MRYEDYIDLKFKPDKTHLVTTLYLEAKNLRHAAGGIAAESSIGTWQEVKTEKQYMKKLAATVFSLKKQEKGDIIKIAYPLDLFENGNMPNILSSVAGNIFGLQELKSLRLLDIILPYSLLKTFHGPKYGIDGIRKIFKTKEPLLGTIIKPKIGLKTQDHAKVAYDAWLGGCDIVKEDENLSNQKFNKFEERLNLTIKAKEKVEHETGKKKGYIANITAETKEMLKRARFVEELGNEYAMIDIITTGFSALQTLRNENLNLILHGHRAGYAAFARSKEFGISMKVIAKISRIIGIDQLHVGTVVGKMYESLEEVKDNIYVLKEKIPFKKVMPVASGGLSPIDIPELLKIFGNDVVIQMGGGIHSHPSGSLAGAKAARQAIDAYNKRTPLKDYAKTHIELKESLYKFL